MSNRNQTKPLINCKIRFGRFGSAAFGRFGEFLLTPTKDYQPSKGSIERI